MNADKSGSVTWITAVFEIENESLFSAVESLIWASSDTRRKWPSSLHVGLQEGLPVCVHGTTKNSVWFLANGVVTFVEKEMIIQKSIIRKSIQKWDREEKNDDTRIKILTKFHASIWTRILSPVFHVILRRKFEIFFHFSRAALY